MSKNISTTPPVSCTLCPRRCGADRAAGQTGFCGAGCTLKAARAALHFWEEPCISGTRGSGTVFSRAAPSSVVSARITPSAPRDWAKRSQ